MASPVCSGGKRCPRSNSLHLHRTGRSPHHHHHHHCLLLLHHLLHHHHCPHCPLHNHRNQSHLQGSHNFNPPLPQNPESFSPDLTGDNSNVGVVEYNQADSSSALITQELEHLELDEEEDDEPVFVLTDEWREFFAKSEAKRQLEKKQRRKGKK